MFQAERKTADNIRHELVANMSEIGLEESILKNITFVTDRGANIKKALQCFSWLPCRCHVLNVILYHAFKMQPENEASALVEVEALLNLNEVIVDEHTEMEVGKLLEAVKDLVAYVKRSGLASKMSSTAIQDIETRWNSKLAMLVSVNEIFGEIQTLLKERNQDHRLQFIDVVLMKDLIELLTPFKAISIVMESDKYPTLHGVLLWQKKLLVHCKRVCSDSPVIRCFKSNLTSLINKKWLDMDLHKVALFCFPKFKSLSILPTTSMRKDVIELVQRMLLDPKFADDNVIATIIVDDHNYETANKRSKTDYAMDFCDFADKYLHADFSGEDFDADGHIGNFDVIKFWKEKTNQCPKLAKLARYVLSIPCSSAASERIFSCASRVYEE